MTKDCSPLVISKKNSITKYALATGQVENRSSFQPSSTLSTRRVSRNVVKDGYAAACGGYAILDNNYTTLECESVERREMLSATLAKGLDWIELKSREEYSALGSKLVSTNRGLLQA